MSTELNSEFLIIMSLATCFRFPLHSDFTTISSAALLTSSSISQPSSTSLKTPVSRGSCTIKLSNTQQPPQSKDWAVIITIPSPSPTLPSYPVPLLHAQPLKQNPRRICLVLVIKWKAGFVCCQFFHFLLDFLKSNYTLILNFLKRLSVPSMKCAALLLNCFSKEIHQ